MTLEGHALAIGYRDRLVGRGLDMALAEGEVLALLGPNGGGKTTLLKTLLGLLPPRAGEVRCAGRALASTSIRERAQLLAYVPQSHVATFAFPVETVVLARALAQEPRFIVLDEPTASLDFGNQGKVMREIRTLSTAGHGVLFTTHDPNQALRLADRAFLLRAGTRVTDGPVRTVLTRENLEELYGAPVGVLTDAATGQTAFLPG